MSQKAEGNPIIGRMRFVFKTLVHTVRKNKFHIVLEGRFRAAIVRRLLSRIFVRSSMFSHLSTETRQIIKTLYGLSDVEVIWAPPLESSHGDLSTSVALKIAKGLGKRPQEIAQAIADAIRLSPSVERADVAGAGYVNIHLTTATLLDALQEVHMAMQPSAVHTTDDPVIVDFCGPNIAKPLGAHHLGSHIIGQAIINVYRHTGTHVIGWSYPGDWGTQFGKLAVAYERWGDPKKAPKDHTVEELLTLYVRFHTEVEKDSTLDDLARAAFRKIEEGDPTLRAFWSDIVAVTKKDLEEIYTRLHVHTDRETGESFYEDKMQSILDEGIAKGVFQEGEKGSLIVPFAEESGLPPLLVRKGDGATLYATRDLAMIRYRIDSSHPSAMYYVVDTAQSLHFRQLFAAAALLGWEMPVHEHTVFGRMRFEGVAMSTRKGTSLRMRLLLDEAVKRASAIIAERGDAIQADDPKDLAEMMGIGAVAYGILSQNRTMDIVFDWDRMLSFEGNSAPYLQYTHARARSVLRKAEEKGEVSLSSIDSLEPEDRELLLMLLKFPAVLTESRDTRMPHRLANYLYALCQSFNAFYNKAPILQAPVSIRALRLSLTASVADVLRTGASLLTIRVPDRM